MKSKVLLVAVVAITSQFVCGQNKIQGYILDRQTSEPLSFAIIADLHQHYGSYTDTTGKFTLNFLNENDSLKVSNLGYKSLFTCVRDLQKSGKILLEANPVQLSEVVVNSKRKKNKMLEIGFFTKKPNSLLATIYPLNIHSIFIPFPEGGSNVLIKSVKFIYQMASRNYTLRVRILKAKTNGQPGDDIITENIVFNNLKQGQKQIAVIDISKYNVYMPHDGVFIALEWIMDKAPLEPRKQLGIDGPYIGILKTNNSSNSQWINAYNNSEWVEVQSRNLLAIGLIVVNYSD
jgi:hypothetical protein